MIHLLIINGPEERILTLERSIDICKPYFDSIRIVQNGGICKSELIKKYTVYSSFDFIPFVDCLDILKSGIRENDWVFVLDSDETPDFSLLSSLEELQKIDCNVIAFPFKHHSINNSGDIYTTFGGTDIFTAPRMHKIEAGIFSAVSRSIHFGYIQKTPKMLTSKNFINHFKHDIAIVLSNIVAGLSHPDSIGVEESMCEFDILSQIREMFVQENGKISLTTVYLNYNNKEFWQKVKPISDKLIDSKVCKLIPLGVDFFINNDKTLEQIFSYNECDRECCEYK